MATDKAGAAGDKCFDEFFLGMYGWLTLELYSSILIFAILSKVSHPHKICSLDH
jgi:hypothetical protein